MTTWSSGAGIVDTYAGLVDTITADAEGEGPEIVDVALAGVGAVADTVGTLIDPFGAIISAGVGWLLEHVSFLREPLDALLGDPDAINTNIDQLKSAAAEIRGIAEQHRQDLAAAQDWAGPTADRFRASMEQAATEIEALSKTMDGTATVVAVSGTLVVMLRGIVVDLITTLITELIRDALIAAASAVVTLGGSIAAFLGVATARAAAVASRIATRIGKLLGGFARQGTRLAKLVQGMEKLADGLGRFSMVADTAKSVYDAAKPYETPSA